MHSMSDQALQFFHLSIHGGKKMKKHFAVTFLVLISLLCNPAYLVGTSNSADSTWAQSSKNEPDAPSSQAPENYVIGLGDVLEVFVWRNEQLSRELVVRPDGKISLPMIQDIQEEGLTVLELRDEITRMFERYINNPRVTVVVREINSYTVSILGKVMKPGVYPITGNTSLLDVISMAGGFTEWAKKKKITVITHHGGKQEKIVVNYKEIASGEDPGQNITLKRGDTIIVP
jgi:polysaccharide export outer membrane protein